MNYERDALHCSIMIMIYTHSSATTFINNQFSTVVGVLPCSGRATINHVGSVDVPVRGTNTHITNRLAVVTYKYK